MGFYKLNKKGVEFNEALVYIILFLVAALLIIYIVATKSSLFKTG